MTDSTTPPANVFDLELPDPYTALTAVETIYSSTGSTVYRLDSQRLTGTLTVQPEAWPAGLMPDRVTLTLGSQHDDGPITDLPVVNGIELAGSCTLRPDHADQLPYELHPYRPAPGITGRRAPERGSAQLIVTAQALLRRWATHPQRPALLIAAARHYAPQRLDRLQRDRLIPLRTQLDQTATELTEAEILAAQLTALTHSTTSHQRYSR